MFEADLSTHENPDWARPLFERQIAILGRLAEAGLEIALAIEREAKGGVIEGQGETASPDHRAFTAYARVARAVRLTLMLQGRLIKQLQADDRQTAQAPGFAAAKAEVARDEFAGQRKARLERIIERVASRQSDDVAEIERLVDETAERLDHDDLYGDVLARPISELVAMICRDLGLDVDWPALAQEAWALEEIKGGPVGWPLASPSPIEGEVAQGAPARGPMGEVSKTPNVTGLRHRDASP